MTQIQKIKAEKTTKKNCNNCPHCIDRKDQIGWHFRGCFGGQYKGKPIAEIEECPLQQEQSGLDLEKEIDECLNAPDYNIVVNSGSFQTIHKDLRKIARHFYELGRSATDISKWDDSDMRYDESELLSRFAFYTYKDEPEILYLSNVFVEETFRNKGIGTKILKAAESVAEILGCINIRLKVKCKSPANAWYRKRGYGYMTFEDGYDWLEKTLEYLKPSPWRNDTTPGRTN